VSSHNARHLLNDEPLTTADVADLLRKTATTDGEFHPGVLRLVAEFDRLRWELAGADERARVAREERDKVEKLYWTLQMTKLPGGKI
jgi:hypothetical protein